MIILQGSMEKRVDHSPLFPNSPIPYNCFMSFTTLFFDLDDTLYPSSSGLWNAIRDRMNGYMYECLNLPPDDIPILRRTYFETYGTTLRGLQIDHGVDADEYLAYVHNLPLEQFLHPHPELTALLLNLPQKKWIFTNADADHARRVLTALGLSECFVGIVDVRAMDFHCKPEPESYRLALALAKETDPRCCVFLDDSVHNLAPARKLGFFTVLVGKNSSHPAAHRTVSRLLDLPQVMPELWAESFDRSV